MADKKTKKPAAETDEAKKVEEIQAKDAKLITETDHPAVESDLEQAGEKAEEINAESPADNALNDKSDNQAQEVIASGDNSPEDNSEAEAQTDSDKVPESAESKTAPEENKEKADESESRENAAEEDIEAEPEDQSADIAGEKAEEKAEEAENEAGDEGVKDKDALIKPQEKAEAKPSKFALMLKKYKLPLIIAAAAVVVALAVVITLLITNRYLVSVSSAEDFSKDTEGKTTYVIKDDVTVDGDLVIPHGMNIDLNKYTLTVKGKLSYGADAGDAEIFIGDKKSKIFTDYGALNAGTVEILSPKCKVIFYAPVTANGVFNVKTLVFENTYTTQSGGSLDIDAESVTFNKAVNIKGAADINCGALTVAKEFDVASKLNITSADLSLNGLISATEVNISGAEEGSVISAGVSGGPLNIINGVIELGGESVFVRINADNASVITIGGRITESLTGGLTVTFIDGSACPLVTGTITLNIYENAEIDEIMYIGTVNFYTRLEAPKDITVSQQGNSIICYVAAVNGADKYVLIIDDVELAPSATNEIDITSHINRPGGHTIKVKAVSDSELLLDSAFTSINYVYNIKLSTPDISIDTSEGYVIIFDSVPFATKYVYTINGEAADFTGFEAGESVEIDITDKLSDAGVYVIKVKAYGENEEAYKPSETAVKSVIINKSLDAVTKDGGAITIVRDGTDLTIDWDAADNAIYYMVYAGDDLLATTKNTSYAFTLGMYGDNTEFKVITKAHGYYLDSVPASVTYEYDTLEAPVINAAVSNGNISISWNAVENAEAYQVYLNDVKVGDPVTELSYTAAHTVAAAGEYTVQAIAEYFRPGISAAKTINGQLSQPSASFTVSEGVVTISVTQVENAAVYELYKVGETDELIDSGSELTFTFDYTGEGEYYVIASAAGYIDSEKSDTMHISVA
jgi:hypothetical protein